MSLLYWLKGVEFTAKAQRSRSHHRRQRFEQLEARQLLATLITHDVTGDTAVAFSDDGVVRVEHNSPPPTSGTGTINPFVRIHDVGSSADGLEEGYNTDARGDADLLDDVGGESDNFNRAITLGEINVITIGNVEYREFRLDLGEPGGNQRLINFSRLQLFRSTSNTENGYAAGNPPTLGGATLIYDMDAINDNDFRLADDGSGQGSTDYGIFIKNSIFAGMDDDEYLYVYSAFGTPPPTADGTFEEWSAVSPSAPPCDPEDYDNTTTETNLGSISGRKFEDMNGDGDDEDGADPGLQWQVGLIDLGANGVYDVDDVVLNAGMLTEADGTYSFDDLLAGSYRVFEVLDDDYTATTVTYYDVTLILSVDDSGVVTVENECGGSTTTGVIVETVSSAAGNDFGNFENITITGFKYEDANGNGTQDDGELPLGGIGFWLNDDGDGVGEEGEYYAVSKSDGTFTFENVGPGDWIVTEADPGTGWVNTQGSAGYGGTAVSGQDVNYSATDLIFGNTAVASENGKTIGFWSNKNGQALIDSADLAKLNYLNLRTATGGDAVFNNAGAVKNFVLNATATNMANMLSAQLAATVLNKCNGFYGESTLVYVGGLTNWSGNSQGDDLTDNLGSLVNEYGFAEISALIDAANGSLLANSVTTSSSTVRTYQEALKIVFDAMNNNRPIFVQ